MSIDRRFKKAPIPNACRGDRIAILGKVANEDVMNLEYVVEAQSLYWQGAPKQVALGALCVVLNACRAT